MFFVVLDLVFLYLAKWLAGKNVSEMCHVGCTTLTQLVYQLSHRFAQWAHSTWSSTVSWWQYLRQSFIHNIFRITYKIKGTSIVRNLPILTILGKSPTTLSYSANKHVSKHNLHQPVTGLTTVCLKNVTALACYNYDINQPILIIFGRNVAKKVSNRIVLYFPTSPNQCFCTAWGNRKPKIASFRLNTESCFASRHRKHIHIITWSQLNRPSFSQELAVCTKQDLWSEYSMLPSVTTHSSFTLASVRWICG